MFLKFTNAVKDFEGQSIAINIDRITTIFEKKAFVVDEEDAAEKIVTVLYAGPNEFWEVKESYLEVLGRIAAI